MVITKRIERVYKFQVNIWEKSSLKEKKRRSQKLNRIGEDGKKEGDKWDE